MPGTRIVRYRFENKLGPRELQLPVDAEIIAAAHFGGAPALWVRLTETEPGEMADLELRRFLLTTTGEIIEEELGRFIGTSIATGHEVLIFELEREDVGAGLDPETADLVRKIHGRLDRIQENVRHANDNFADLERSVDTLSKAIGRLGEER